MVIWRWLTVQFFKLGNGMQQAHLDYAHVKGKEGNVLDFHHTFVPEEATGKGLAALLVKVAS